MADYDNEIFDTIQKHRLYGRHIPRVLLEQDFHFGKLNYPSFVNGCIAEVLRDVPEGMKENIVWIVNRFVQENILKCLYAFAKWYEPKFYLLLHREILVLVIKDLTGLKS